ncbi:hypothetical protein ACFQQB_59275 [Nonomuraea rubra]|uniref:hypothetical protein n=1 Tax=Nonomuraea rubra TaxID=46180 RepID=UPI003607AA7C
MTSFKDEQIAGLAASGWARCGPVAEAVARARLPAVTAGYLAAAFPGESWVAAERAVLALRGHFASARFADEITYGILLVPDAGRLDTRRPMPPSVRAGQLGEPAGDVFDDRLPPGVLGVEGGRPWTMVATVTGAYGPSLGSHHQVVSAPAAAFTVAGADTRALMIRRLWGRACCRAVATCPTARPTRGGPSPSSPAKASPAAWPSRAPCSRARCGSGSASRTAASAPPAWLPPSPSPDGPLFPVAAASVTASRHHLAGPPWPPPPVRPGRSPGPSGPG